jgi:hypothetical protein
MCIPRPQKKPVLRKKKKKNWTDQHDEDHLATWNVRSLYRTGDLRITINELRKYNRQNGINLPHKPLRAMVITSIPAALPIIMNLEQLF